MPGSYEPVALEAKWQKKWDEAKVYEIDLQEAKKPYYTHVMFPYPSGDKLHVGHWYNFGPADSFARFKRMQGNDVFSPIGFDAFGLPAENHAIKTGVHPSKSIAENVATMSKQLKRIGCMYDWSKSVNTSTPEYYRWTQWLFLEMFRHGLAFQKEGNVNFCPSCQTVLANEQVWDGKCERCESDVVQKPLKQWFLKITDYSEKLLDGLETLDWPEKTKLMQRNWIGRSEGCNVHWEVAGVMRGILGYLQWPGSLAGDLNRRLTNEWKGRIHSPIRTTHLVFTPYRRISYFEEKLHAKRLLQILERTAEKHEIAMHDAAVMPDHVHLLISFHAERHLERDIIKKLKGASSRAFQKNLPIESGHLWGERQHYENIENAEQFIEVLRYIHTNPHKASITDEGRILSQVPLVLQTFTTTVDTIFGVTFAVISPEHPNLDRLLTNEQRRDVEEYCKKATKKTELERMALEKEKSGVPTGNYLIHPFTDKKVPLWVADYVLMTYGTGIVMGVPAHDQRDMDFAMKYKLPIVQSIQSEDGRSFVYDDVDKYTVKGTLIDSEMFTGLPILEGRKRIVKDLSVHGMATEKIQYKLRDWSIGRQRYWGALIPIVYDPEGNSHAVPEEHLPWLLPTDVEFKPTGKSPIADSQELKERTERIFGKGWTPEVDTMDTFVCSSFYSLRYLAEGNQTELVPKTVEKKWMPIDMYIGGAEHACMHLIYTRFVGMALKDFGHISCAEQYQRLVHQGVITNKGTKMSKSKGNVVSPDEFVNRYGSDVFRMFLMFMGPFTEGGDWSDTGIKGVARFASRIHTFITGVVESGKCPPAGRAGKVESENRHISGLLHRTIKKVSDDIEKLHFNTALSSLMIFLNEAEKVGTITKETAITFTKLLAPLAPHLAEELWESLGQEGFIIEAKWPDYDEKLTVSDTITLVVQVNGKVRANIEVPSDISESEAITKAKEHENVRKYLEGKQLKKEMYVQGKLVSLVV